MPRLSKDPIPVKKEVLPRLAETSELFQGARLAHQAGRLAEAQNGYLQVLSRDENYADALHLLGVVHLQTGRLTEAEDLIRQALALKESAVFLGNLGNLLKVDQRPEEAEAAYRRALELKPDHVDVHNQLGLLLQGGRRLVEAEAAYRRALELKPNHAKTHHNLGNLFKDCKCRTQAEAAYRRALELKPDYAEAHHNLGTLLMDDNRLAEAEAAYRRALEIKPGYAEARFKLSILFLASH